MSDTVNETITVSELSKYGVKIGNVYYNYGKKWDTKVTLSPGLTYVVEIWTSASGKKYMNKLVQGPLGNAPVAAPAATPAPAATQPVPAAAALASSHVGAGTKARDFDAEARGKTRCALFAAAIQSPAAPVLAATELELINFAKRVADEGVKFTFGD